MENIFYINLDNRKDRRKTAEQQFNALDWKGERIKAVKLKNGLIGCGLSHLKCIKLAKKRDLDMVLICEDDIYFTNPILFKKQLTKFLSSDISWDVAIIAGNNVPPYEKHSDYCIKVSHCQCCTGYIVKKHYYDTLMDNFYSGIKLLMQAPEKHREYAVDKYWISLQKKDNWFMIIPATVTQKPDYSDIEKKVTNYNWHLLDIDKPHWIERRALTEEEIEEYKRKLNII